MGSGLRWGMPEELETVMESLSTLGLGQRSVYIERSVGSTQVSQAKALSSNPKNNKNMLNKT